MGIKDLELMAMSETIEALKSLEKEQVRRIVTWLKNRFNIEDGKIYIEEKEENNYTDYASITSGKGTSSAIEARVGKEKKQWGGTKKKSIKDFDTVLDLFAESTVKRAGHKILLMAAYLQEKQDLKDITSYDINFRLKRIGHGIQNISSVINTVLRENPVILQEIQEGSPGTNYSRKKFHVTAEGLKLAESFITV